MSCSQARRELLEHLALSEELGPRADRHLAHLQSCADCREEMGINRELVQHLRLALQERVAGSGPSQGTWGEIRRRTLEGPPQSPRTMRVAWGGLLSAAAAGVMILAVAAAPQTRLLPEVQPALAVVMARPDLPAVDGLRWSSAPQSTSVPPPTYGPLPGWPMQTQVSVGAPPPDDELPISARVP